MSPLRSSDALLGEGEPPAVELVRRGRSPFVFVCDHASGRLPRALGSLGLTPAALASHIAWDIGAAAVARLLAVTLDGDLVLQAYSRLVIDCNRPLDAPDSIVALSAGVAIPGNRDLSAAEADPARAGDLRALPRSRSAASWRSGRRSTAPRCSWPCTASPPLPGVAAAVARRRALTATRSSPHRWPAGCWTCSGKKAGCWWGTTNLTPPAMLTDFTIVEHGERRGLPHVELEIRQDLIADGTGRRRGRRAWRAPAWDSIRS